MDFHTSIITPSGRAFDGKVSALSAPGVAGGFGVLAGHAPLLAGLRNGALKITQSGKDYYFSIAQGILEVNHEHNCLILCDRASSAASLEEAENASKEFKNN